jgi:transposase
MAPSSDRCATMWKFLEAGLQRVTAEINALINRHPPLRKQRELLRTISGIAALTASRILGEMPNISEYRNAKAVAAFAGLSPREHQSGTMRGRTRLAKTGNWQLRKILYFPAMSATRFNPLIKALDERLVAAGKPKIVALAAAMRKLLVLAYGVLKSNQPVDPAFGHA